MKPVRIRVLLPTLVVALAAGGWLLGSGDGPGSSVRTTGEARNGEELSARTAASGIGQSSTTGSTAGTSTSAPPTTVKTPAPPPAPVTTAAPAPLPLGGPTGQTDGGRPVWAPNIDASGASDVSAKMAAFLTTVPSGSTIDLKAGGRYRMEKTLLISKRQNLALRGNGATFVATTTGDLSRASVRIDQSAGLTIRDLKVVGANPLAGAKSSTYNAAFGGQHGFEINSSTGVKLIGVTVTDTYGDFVYVGGKDGLPPSDGVLIQASTFARSGRQGITMTKARNVVVETSSITEAKRSTFDFEPGAGAGGSVDRVTIRNNRVSNGRLNFVSAAGHGPVDNITIQGNRATGMTITMAIGDLDGGLRRNWSVLDNTGDLKSGNAKGATMVFLRINGLVVRGNTQTMKPGRNMYGVSATNSCNVVVTGNNFPNSVGQVKTAGTC